MIEAEIVHLKSGECITVKAFGNSMKGIIENGQFATIGPVNPTEIKVGDTILVRWKKKYFILHTVGKISESKLLIINSKGKINGWVEHRDICGKLINVSW